MQTCRRSSAFTLIELLIVVAIIAILAAIAVPNFMEAQTRSKVARVKADHRSIATALEAYRVDANSYVLGAATLTAMNIPYTWMDKSFVRWGLAPLTTPIAYMASLPPTPFLPKRFRHSGGYVILTHNTGSEYDFLDFERLPVMRQNNWFRETGCKLSGATDATRWFLRDPGPYFTFNNQGMLEYNQNNTNLMPYDPTNGTVSIGDIWRFGP